ncbi:hypothetical protein CYMTET_26936 [Cymbomonas tetramitiformis]|uniref:Uncharacterized protein n=1 Tax=Cymbomonas tetramitiformis TaxID=36881 RepID=A0AAE0FQS8_9CHLO|nr:hypothetical protein CYMTET_26936 [Cymbomonas tetramitiformis]
MQAAGTLEAGVSREWRAGLPRDAATERVYDSSVGVPRTGDAPEAKAGWNGTVETAQAVSAGSESGMEHVMDLMGDVRPETGRVPFSPVWDELDMPVHVHRRVALRDSVDVAECPEATTCAPLRPDIRDNLCARVSSEMLEVMGTAVAQWQRFMRYLQETRSRYKAYYVVHNYVTAEGEGGQEHCAGGRPLARAKAGDARNELTWAKTLSPVKDAFALLQPAWAVHGKGGSHGGLPERAGLTECWMADVLRRNGDTLADTREPTGNSAIPGPLYASCNMQTHGANIVGCPEDLLVAGDEDMCKEMMLLLIDPRAFTHAVHPDCPPVRIEVAVQ